MEYTQLGRTGLKVSRLCLGTMNFGPHTTEADSFAIMDHALELGVNFFDTANVYGWKKGEGVTEQIVGRWFAQGGGRREKTIIATKVYGNMGDWPNESRLSALHIRQFPHFFGFFALFFGEFMLDFNFLHDLVDLGLIFGIITFRNLLVVDP